MGTQNQHRRRASKTKRRQQRLGRTTAASDQPVYPEPTLRTASVRGAVPPPIPPLNFPDDINNTCKDLHAIDMADGGVLAPHLFVVRDNVLLGYVGLRPVYTGQDATRGVAQMSYLAAVAKADEIIAAWETLDLAIACQHASLRAGPSLNMIHATATTHTLYGYPYQVRYRPGRTSTGLPEAEPHWLAESATITDAPLEPAIHAMVRLCWQPLDIQRPDIDMVSAAATSLRELGYTVGLTEAAVS
ncbi:hypothetical protein [Nonomuraea jabiensis]|uniref:hypothetical protein n=1 Tax=Nonomuraea jabiensis TaxID=882448 RepID=UPI003D71F9DD